MRTVNIFFPHSRPKPISNKTVLPRIDPIPYSDSSDSGRDYWRDPKMREQPSLD